MKSLLFGSPVTHRTVRPVLCCDCTAILAKGTGEPTYTVCEPCRVRRGIVAMKARRDINHAFDPKSGYRRRKKT